MSKIKNNNLGIIFRRRRNNWYSWAPLIPVLRNSGFKHIIQVKTLNTASIQNKLAQYQTLIYLDSFHSLFFWENYQTIKDELQWLKQFSNNVFTVVGGPHSTGDPQSCLAIGFDYVVRGEGERILPKLVNRLVNGKNIEDLASLVFFDGKQVVINDFAPLIDLDEYQPYCEQPSMHPPIEIMRGCPFHCHFCQTPFIFKKVRFRSLDAVEKIVEHYIEKYAARRSVDIRFIAPNFLGYQAKRNKKPNIPALTSLRKMLERKDVRMFLGTFPAEVRPDFVTAEVITEFLTYSHSNNVAIGLQSGSNDVLERVKRGHSVEEAMKAIDLLIEYDFKPLIDFIVGFPDETRTEQFKTLDLIKNLTQRNCKIRMHYFIPLPGTPLGNKEPAEVDPQIIKELGRLTKEGKVEGAYSRQLKRVKYYLDEKSKIKRLVSDFT